MRKGVYFHHGRELTSRDVKFTLLRVKSDEQKSPFRWLFHDVEDILIPDKYSVVLKLARPNPLLLNHLSFDRVSIVPEDVVQQMGGSFRHMPVGTGPFKISRHDESMLVLEAFPRYYDKRAHLDRIEIWFSVLTFIHP